VPPFDIRYTADAQDHLRAMTAREQSLILDRVELQLAHEPDVETRNRKLMRANPLASWELRIGTFRVYYDIEEGSRTVVIIAVGVKQHNRVSIGGKVIEL
jgi:mRNA-degrading endonuclease RelE of RelBE toxin-antitoxin system